MARLNKQLEDDSDDSLPDLASILLWPSEDTAKALTATSERQRATDSRSQSTEADDVENLQPVQRKSPSKSISKASYDEKQLKKQRPLAPLKITHDNSLLLPLSNGSSKCAKSPAREQAAERFSSVRQSPKRAAKACVDYRKFVPLLTDPSSDEDDSFTDLSGFIVPDSASEDELLGHKSRNGLSRSPRRNGSSAKKANPPKNREDPFGRWRESAIIDLTSPEKESSSIPCLGPSTSPISPSKEPQKSGNCSDLDEPFSRLRFSPPRSKSPYKCTDTADPVTPPSSPSKTRLKSPSKAHRIPPSPHRPSIDAFWSQDVINDWNDEYSPKKTPKTVPSKLLHPLDEDDESVSPSVSPPKSPSKTPSKSQKAALAAFNAQKHTLATTFLTTLDQTITNGQIASLSNSTGGVQIIWSKKLTSTAGRATWRRETLRHKPSASPPPESSTNPKPTHRHHASIELAEKVIDTETRLLNVLAHEYCHLANFMISGIKDQPHGASFKAWARKTTALFHTQGVEVTTKHTYEIAFKYAWVCPAGEGGCGMQYQRHSRSIDPRRHRCGGCKGGLRQVRPPPREGGGGEFQMYVREEYETVKGRNPGAGFGEVMGILGRGFREGKRRGGGGWGGGEGEGKGTVGGGGGGAGGQGDDGGGEGEGLDAVVQELDSLRLDT